MKQINWGIIGLGNIALKFADGFKSVDNAKLIGISSKSKQKLQKFKEEFHIEENFCFNDYESLLKCKDIDIVYIALPNSLHYEWILKCIKEGKKVLCEKPATVNFSQIKKIKEAILKKKLLFAEALMYRYHPQIIKVMELINENEIGKLISMESYFGSNILTKKNFFGFRKINEENRIYNKELGGGAILDLGCYPSSFSLLISSLVPNINYNQIEVLNVKKEVGRTGVDLDSYAELNFSNKLNAKIGASFTQNLGKKTKIIGDNGELEIEDTWHGDPSLINIKGKNSYQIKVESRKNIYSYEIEHLSKCIIENKQEANFPGMKLNDTIINMKILEDWLNHEK